MSADWSFRELALPAALALLLDVVEGKPCLVDNGMRTNKDTQAGAGCYRRPTLSQRISAANVLLAKTLPDVRSVDINQVVDATVKEEQPLDARQTARAILFFLAQASEENGTSFGEAGGPVDGADAVQEACLSPPEKFQKSD